jgi:hypothetical protein
MMVVVMDKKTLNSLKEKNEVGFSKPILPSFYIPRRSCGMLVHISCNGQHYAFHIPEHMHRIHRHTDYKTALQTGCPLTSMLQMSNKQQHILCLSERNLPSS